MKQPINNKAREREAQAQLILKNSPMYTPKRGDLAMCIASLTRRGLMTPSTVVSDSFLRVKQPLINSQNNLTFDIAQNGTPAADEQKLNINDSFYVTDYGFMLTTELTGAALNVPYASYPNEVEFANTGVPADLEIVYKGSFSVTVNSTVILETTDLQRFRTVPQTQKALAADKSQFEKPYAMDSITPNVFFNGRASNQIEVTIPALNGANIQGTNNYTNYLVMYVKGFLVKNVSFEM